MYYTIFKNNFKSFYKKNADFLNFSEIFEIFRFFNLCRTKTIQILPKRRYFRAFGKIIA